MSLNTEMSKLKKSSQFNQLCFKCGKTWVGRVDPRYKTCGCGQGWYRETSIYRKRFSRWKYKGEKSKWEWNLEFEDLEFPTHCPLLGLELLYTGGRGQTSENASLDRIDPTVGYVKGNVWIISYRANRLKNDATLEELEFMLENWRNCLPKVD